MDVLMHVRRSFPAACLPVIGLLLVAGCSTLESVEGPHDEAVGLTREAFAEALARPVAVPAPIPARSRLDRARSPRAMVTEEPPVDRGPGVDLGPPVTLSVNETVPLKDVLLSLARQAGREIEIDPRIEGGIILAVRDRPFLKVVERIARLAGLRFSVEDGILRMELDEPYQRTYRLNFLDVERRFASSVSTSVNVFTEGGGGAGGGNGSTNTIDTRSTNDLWTDIETTLTQLLSTHAPERLCQRARIDAGGVQERADGEAVSPLADGPGDPPPAASSSAGPLAAEPSAGPSAPPSAPADVVTVSAPTHRFTLNRTAGLLNVHASSRQHAAIEEYLERLRGSLNSQVLIEAKILEVTLDDEFRTGINWRAVLGDVSAAAPLGGSLSPVAGPFDSLSRAAADVFSVALEKDDLQGVLSLIERFGTTRTLSSPRVTVMQGHTAVLKVAENQVFFQLTIEREKQEFGDDLVTVSSEINTVPVGVVITVQPSIDLEKQAVSMTLRPTITRITDTIADPAVAIASNNTVQSLVPVVAVQEIDSVVKMGSGGTIVMGGLMQDDALRADEGVPGLSRVPLLGHLFKARDEVSSQRELVIFLRATIVADDTAAIGPKDRDLYGSFARDPRPLDTAVSSRPRTGP